MRLSGQWNTAGQVRSRGFVEVLTGEGKTGICQYKKKEPFERIPSHKN